MARLGRNPIVAKSRASQGRSDRPEADWVRGLKELLAAAGYTGDGVRERLGIRHPDDVGPLNRAAVLERLRAASDPLAALLRLFFLETPVTSREADVALRRHDVERLVRARLLRQRGAKIAARLRLDAVRDGLFFADRRFCSPDRRAAGLPSGDTVYPVCSDSVMLAEVVAEQQGARVLDLCSGTGVQGILAASWAREVIAVDVGRRAVAMARLNARLNGLGNVVVRQGDLYEPVAGERFDLIVANPPFVPSPHRGPAYHSGGPLGDRILRRVVEGFEAHLGERGRAYAISHLALRRGQDVAAAVGPWLSDFGGRSMALVFESGTAVDLAAAQAIFALEDGLAAYEREVGRWVRFLERHGAEQVVALVLVAERRGHRGFEVVDGHQRSLTLPVTPPVSQLVERWLAA